jgi:hypothetical protein
MGMPTWLLLPGVCDWRWMHGRDTSPWYPSVRIFRQTMPGEWRDVIERVRGELEILKTTVG